jgi:hypothetical protein
MADKRLRALEYLTAGWMGDMIRAELAVNNHDPALAIANISDFANAHLGQHGCCNDHHRIEVRSTVKNCRGAMVWYGADHWDRPPDEIITWRDIFGYVAGESQQLTLF